MALKDIVTVPDKLLRKRSQRVSALDKDTRALIKDMTDTTLDWEKHRENEVGVAMAAIQIGHPLCVIIVRADVKDQQNHDFDVFINPRIVKKEGDIGLEPEGCLSVKDVYGLVPRYDKVKIKALNAQGQPIRITATGFQARIFQHEIDHTRGKLFIDHVKDNKFYLLDDKGELRQLPPEEVKKRDILSYRHR